MPDLTSIASDRLTFSSATLGKRFERDREIATGWITTAAIISTLVVAGAAYFSGNGTIWFVTVASLVLASLAIGTRLLDGKMRRVMISLILIGQCILANAALLGNPMQADSHMLYFAALTGITLMSSRPALLASSALIIAHHLTVSFIMPQLAFLSQDLLFNLFRTSFHAVVVALAVVSLYAIVHVRLVQTFYSERRAEQLEAAMEKAQAALAEAERRSAEAQAAQARAEEATALAQQAHSEAEAAQKTAEEMAEQARKAEAKTSDLRARYQSEVEEVISLLHEKLMKVANGDLTARIDTPLPAAYADLSESFNTGIGRLEKALASVEEEVISIQKQSGEINAAAEDLRDRTDEQVRTLTETAATLQQLTSLIADMANETKVAGTVTEKTKSEADAGAQVMAKTVSAMDQIEDSSDAIRKITSVIDDIAFQTNLLSLNAGVEAARAGEAGRGFAVVANEVRALAQRSSNAAKEIEELISDSTNHVNRGVELVKSTGSALASIRDSVGQTATRVGKVAEATADQSRGLTDVSRAITSLEAVAQQNAHMFQQTLSANAVLLGTAQELANRVSQFQLKGGTARPARSKPVLVSTPRTADS